MTTQTFRRLAARTLGALALTAVVAACDNPVDQDPHPDAAAVVVQTSAGAEVARATATTVTGSISLTTGATRDLRVIFVDAANNPVPVGGDTCSNYLARVKRGRCKQGVVHRERLGRHEGWRGGPRGSP